VSNRTLIKFKELLPFSHRRIRILHRLFVIQLITHVVQKVCQALINVKCASMIETVKGVYTNSEIKQCVGCV
jgi:hypothetical protein